jgi:hypothetical protein
MMSLVDYGSPGHTKSSAPGLSVARIWAASWEAGMQRVMAIAR